MEKKEMSALDILQDETILDHCEWLVKDIVQKSIIVGIRCII